MGGSAIRAGITRRGLRRLGEVISVVLDDHPWDDPAAARDLRVATRTGGHRISHRLSPVQDAVLLRSAGVDRLVGGEWALTDGPLPPIDLAWFTKASSYVRLRHLAGAAPVIVDFDDLEENTRQHPVAGLAALDRWATGGLRARIARAADRVCLCSEEDAQRAGLPGVEVLPNSAPVGAHAPASPLPDDPVLLFVGVLGYRPNRRAVTWFVDAVLPTIQQQVPGARLLVVGPGAETLPRRVHSVVDAVGAVADTAPFFRRSRAVVVPLREGSGTRIKLLEGLAHARPVVTTTLGAEGLPVTDGHTALVRDDAGAFATACVRVLEDDQLARHLSAQGHALFAERFAPETVEAHVARIAVSLLESRGHAATSRGPR